MIEQIEEVWFDSVQNFNKMSSIKPPKPLLVNHDIDMAQEWSEWLEMYDNYFIAAKISEESEEIQAANFKATIGRPALKVLNSLGLTEAQKKDIAVIKTKLSAYFTPAKNKTYERCQFHRIQQQNGESFEDFYQKLRVQVEKCSYGVNADEFVKDQIVLGINKEVTRQKMWIEDDLTLDKAIKICRAEERANKQMAELHTEHTQSVNAIKKYNNRDQNKGNKSAEKEFDCKRCGVKHGVKSCPAYKKKCKKCGKLGHFQVMCRASKKVHLIDTDSEDSLVIGSLVVASNGGDNDKWLAKVSVGKHKLKLKLDTGAECNVLSEKDAMKINAKIEKSKTKNLIAYNNESIKVIGESKVHCRAHSSAALVTFKIIKEGFQPVLGRDMCEKLGFIMRINQIKENDAQTSTLSYCKNFEYDIDFVDEPEFKIIPARRIAYPLREQVKKELDKMVKMRVIEAITEPTPAVSPMLVVQKGSSIRVCMDPTELNKNIKRRHYPLKTVEEIAAKVGKAKYFTKLDCQKGFWQIKVSDASSKYLTFSTPWGRFRYLRLPFGICSAPEIFSEIMNRTLQGINNCEIAMDDIFLFAETKEELKKITDEVTKRLDNAGFTLNQNKCEYAKTKVKFLGHIFTQHGYEADNEKIEAIKLMKTPTNVTELQRLLGMVNYLGKFIPNLSDLTEPLRQLLHKDTAWVWGSEQDQAVANIKKTLSSTPVLKYYDVNKNVKLSVDASSKAMGACLMQDDQPVAYATRAFSTGQQNYPQIEKEAMAIKFACRKFHEYVYGKQLLVETDHQPLETIFKKSLQCAPLRLQKILWDVIQYSPTVKYVKGTKIPIADTLSRDTNVTEVEADDEYRINIILSMTDEAKKRFQEATAQDTELQLLKDTIQQGWSSNNNEIPKEIRKHATFKEEITYEDGLLFKANKVIVPKSETANMIKQIHTGHAGITKSLARSRRSLYWHGQAGEIREFIESCAVCQQTQKANAREPMILKKIPEFPFQIVSTDIFMFKGNDFILIADHYSGFMDFRKLKASTSQEVILYLRMWFGVHGIPEILESDGGPQYTSKQFADFTASWKFQHHISSPHYPRSNGFAERNVQTAKNLLKQCYLDNTDVYLALLLLRNTPRNEALKSPNERLFSRQTRTILPIDREQLKPKVIHNVSTELRKLRLEQKNYVDRVSVPLKKLIIGDKVRIKTGHREWIGGKVIDETKYPRSLIVQTDEGKVYRRNTHHLHKTKADINTPCENNIRFESNDDVATEPVSHNQTSMQSDPVLISTSESTSTLPMVLQPPTTTTKTTTRSGRIIKKPVKFDPSDFN